MSARATAAAMARAREEVAEIFVDGSVITRSEGCAFISRERRSRLKETAISGFLQAYEPPACVASYVEGFVHRDEDPGPQVVRVLPELRPSIQFMMHEPYWLRNATNQGDWRRLPRFALWGPRYTWCYGFAAGRINAYAFSLKSAAFAALTRTSTAHHLDTVHDLGVVEPQLASALEPYSAEPFDDWRARAVYVIADFFAAHSPPHDPISPTLPILATAENNAVAAAATHSGLSERQYRRVFAHLYGVSPKLYQRALRVDRMIRQLHAAPWEDDAFAETPIAFADQPHAIREFRNMTGITPGEYIRIKRAGGATLRSVPTYDVAPPLPA